jgi:hypothetical protein
MQGLSVDGRKGNVRSMLGNFVRIRVHWAPYFIPQTVINAEIQKFCKVKQAEFEKSIAKGMEHVNTLIRAFHVETQSVGDIPHMIHVVYNGVKYPLLLTVQGRPPLCLKCHRTGHIRRDCYTAYCRNCRDFGHDYGDCPQLPEGKSTYASKLKQQRDDGGLSDYITEEEAVTLHGDIVEGEQAVSLVGDKNDSESKTDGNEEGSQSNQSDDKDNAEDVNNKEEKNIVQDSSKGNDGQDKTDLRLRRGHSVSESSTAVSSDGESECETVIEQACLEDPDPDWRNPPPQIPSLPFSLAITEPPDSDSDQDKLVVNLEVSPQCAGGTDL